MCALAGTVALGASGCGEEPLTKAELVKQADAICKRFDTQSEALYKRAVARARRLRVSIETAYAEVRPELIAQRRQAIDDLDGLETTDDLSATYDKMTTAMKVGLAAFPSSEQLRAGEDPEQKQRQAAEERSQRLAKELGFAQCP